MSAPEPSPEVIDQAILSRTVAIAGLANACASCQLSAFGVAGASIPLLLKLPEQSDAWLPGAFLLGVLCVVPLTELLCARLGARRLLIACLAALLIVELLLCLSRSLPLLLWLTFVMGAVLAPLPPSTQALIDAEVPAGSTTRDVATTVWSCGTTAGGLWGAVSAGLAIAHWGWAGFCFLASPLALLALLLLTWLPATASPPRRLVDRRALLALPCAFGFGGFVLNAGPELGFTSPTALAALLLALAALGIFLAFNGKGEVPVLQLSLLRSAPLVQALILAIGVAAFSTGMLETLFLGLFDHFDSEELGLRGGGGGVMMVAGSTLGGWMSARKGPLPTTAAGLLVLCAGKVGFLWYDPGITLWEAFLPAFISSLGYGIVTTSITFLAFTDPACRGAAAASMLLLAWQFGDAFGLPLVEALYREDVPVKGSLAAYHDVFKLELWVTLVLCAVSLLLASRKRTLRSPVPEDSNHRPDEFSP